MQKKNEKVLIGVILVIVLFSVFAVYFLLFNNRSPPIDYPYCEGSGPVVCGDDYIVAVRLNPGASGGICKIEFCQYIGNNISTASPKIISGGTCSVLSDANYPNSLVCSSFISLDYCWTNDCSSTIIIPSSPLLNEWDKKQIFRPSFEVNDGVFVVFRDPNREGTVLFQEQINIPSSAIIPILHNGQQAFLLPKVTPQNPSYIFAFITASSKIYIG